MKGTAKSAESRKREAARGAGAAARRPRKSWSWRRRFWFRIASPWRWSVCLIGYFLLSHLDGGVQKAGRGGGEVQGQAMI